MSDQPETILLINSIIDTEYEMKTTVIKTLASRKLHELSSSSRVIFEAAIGAALAQGNAMSSRRPGEPITELNQTDQFYMKNTGDGMFDLLREIINTQSRRTR